MSVSHDLLLHQEKQAACWFLKVGGRRQRFVLVLLFESQMESFTHRFSSHSCWKPQVGARTWDISEFLWPAWRDWASWVQQGHNKRSRSISTLSPGGNTEIWRRGEKLQYASHFSTTLCLFSIFCTLFCWVLFLYSSTCNHLSVHLLLICQIHLFSTSRPTDVYASLLAQGQKRNSSFQHFKSFTLQKDQRAGK